MPSPQDSHSRMVYFRKTVRYTKNRALWKRTARWMRSRSDAKKGNIRNRSDQFRKLVRVDDRA